MRESDAPTLLDEEISATTLAFAALSIASLLSLGIFVFLVYHDIIRKLLGTSVIGFVVFGVLGAAKFRELLALRHLKRKLLAGAVRATPAISGSSETAGFADRPHRPRP